MSTAKRTMIGAALVSAVGVATAGAAAAGADGDEDFSRVSDSEAQAATAAALAATGGGTANSVERDGENGATWEVEVTQPDGSTVDVRLDVDYSVVIIESDSESDDGR